MEVLYVLVPLGVLVALAGGLAFFAAAQAGQFDDLERPAVDLLSDEGPAKPPQ